MKKKDEVWIGMLTVVPVPGNSDLGDAKGAVVNVLYYTHSKKNYIEEVDKIMNEYGYSVREFEDVEPFDFNANSKSLVRKAKSIGDSKRFAWDKFYLTDEIS